jgi:hypothetical protein
MKQVIFNIGLNNNTKNSYGVITSILNSQVGLSKWKVEDGEYVNSIEPTVVAYGHTELGTEQILEEVEKMCVFMTQECIAVMIDGVGYLVYDPSFEGDRYEFDKQYFLTW